MTICECGTCKTEHKHLTDAEMKLINSRSSGTNSFRAILLGCYLLDSLIEESRDYVTLGRVNLFLEEDVLREINSHRQREKQLLQEIPTKGGVIECACRNTDCDASIEVSADLMAVDDAISDGDMYYPILPDCPFYEYIERSETVFRIGYDEEDESEDPIKYVSEDTLDLLEGQNTDDENDADEDSDDEDDEDEEEDDNPQFERCQCFHVACSKMIDRATDDYDRAKENIITSSEHILHRECPIVSCLGDLPRKDFGQYLIVERIDIVVATERYEIISKYS